MLRDADMISKTFSSTSFQISKKGSCMKAKLRLHGQLALTHGTQIELDLKDGITWGEAIDYVFKKFNLGRISHKRGSPIAASGYLLLFLNGKAQVPEVKLSDGDEISILNPLVGG